MSKTSSRPAIRMPSVAEDKATTAAARNDPDATPLTQKQLSEMVPAKALRGRAKSTSTK